jgi:hypothetical protein
MTDDDCLHCKIMELVGPEIESGRLAVNEAMYKLAECIGHTLSGVGDRNARRQLLRSTFDEATKHARRFRADRVKSCVGDYDTVRWQ